jgi:hypothetical protein
MHREVGARRALAAVVGGEAEQAAALALGRWLDLDHLRAEIDEQSRGDRPGEVLGDIEDANTFENFLVRNHVLNSPLLKSWQLPVYLLLR